MNKSCPNCGVDFDTLEGKYAPDGTIVCVPCGDRMAKAAHAAETKSAGSAFMGAFGALLIALVSFVVEHRFVFFLFPIIAIVGGAGTAGVALRNQRAIETLGWKRIPTIGIGVLAAILGLVSLVLGFAR